MKTRRNILKVNDPASDFRQKIRAYYKNSEYFIELNNHNYKYPHNPFPNILAVGNISIIKLESPENAFSKLRNYHSSTQDWLFGYFSYDLKNDIERLKSQNKDYKSFPELYFVQPEHIFEFQNGQLIIHSSCDPKKLYYDINVVDIPESPLSYKRVDFEQLCDKGQYLKTVERLRQHIYEGDVYEINFCMEFICNHLDLDSDEICKKLWELSPTPFASFMRLKDYHLICASPERFLKLENDKLISQPIKGTVHSGTNEEEKAKNSEILKNSEKERAENMMIVDLVRNDLAKSSIPGSVKVEEIFGIYEFRHLLHMISTVTSQPQSDITPVEMIKNAFPMGSMTGAPKIKVMELIEEYENSKRGVFSGASGYFKPNGDFDFNVIIRSLFYNKTHSKLSYSVGGAITYDSIPEEEYEECILKAKAIKELFNKN